MKRRIFALAALAILVLVVGVVLSLTGIISRPSTSTYAATVQAQSPMVSGVQVMNQSSTTTANITIDFYDQNGNKVATVTDTIPPNASKPYYSPNITGLTDGFIGSAVVSSDQPVAAILNTQTPSSTGSDPSDPYRVGTSAGVVSPATTLYFPKVERTYYGWNSKVYIQNTSGSSASVTLTFYSSNGTQMWQTSQTVPANSSATFDQGSTAESSLGNGWYGSAVATSSAPLAGIGIVANSNTTPDTSQMPAYNAFSSGATKVNLPKVVKNYYGFNSGLSIQNLGTSACTPSVTVYMGSQQYVLNGPSISPNVAWSFYMAGESTVPNGAGAAVVTCSQPVVVAVGEDFRAENYSGPASGASPGFAYMYNGFPDGSATNTVVLPKIDDKYYGYASGFQIQNVGSGSANMTATFVGGGSTYTVQASGIAPNTAWKVFAPQSLPGSVSNFDGAATITSNQPVIGIANTTYRYDIDPRYGVKYGDSDAGYNGLNR